MDVLIVIFAFIGLAAVIAASIFLLILWDIIRGPS